MLAQSNYNKRFDRRSVTNLREKLKSDRLLAAEKAGGPSDMNGDRLTRIEGRLATIEAEQRAHLRWMMLIAIGLASLFATGFGFMMVRIDRTEDKISRVEDRISRVE